MTAGEETSVPTTVLVFGDATDSWVDGLDQVYKQAVSTPWLKGFLDELRDVVVAEIQDGNLDSTLKENVGHFATFQELSDRYRHTSEKYGLVQALLLHAVRASTLLQWVKREPRLLDPEAPVEWLGFSGGLLTVSAMAVSDDFDSLYENLLDAARFVFRAARLASVRSRAIEDQAGQWGWAVLGMAADELSKTLSQFQQSIGIPPPKRARVGVIGAGYNVVIGPPSVLERVMKQCPALKSLAKNGLEIKALQHTLDGLTSDEVKALVGEGKKETKLVAPGRKVWGMGDATSQSQGENFDDLLRAISVEVLEHPLNIPQVLDQLSTHLESTSHVRLVQLGNTSHAATLHKKLQPTVNDVSVLDQSALLRPRDQDAASMFGKVAIVGVAGRGPKSDNIDQLWDVLMSKQDLCTEIPKDRFDVDEYYCPDHERGDKRCKMSTRYGVFMDNPGHFDSRFFHISPREALLMEPNHRQFLMSTYEALETAGYSDGATRNLDHNRIAAFYAQATDDWHKNLHPTTECDSYTLQGIQRAFGPGRVAFSFNWEGPTYSLDAACAGTTTCIHLACLSLQSRDIDMAVAGAANILNWPHSFTCLSDSGILSDTGNCKPFRDDADGYARGDFIGSVVLKRLEDAIEHNDNILGVIAGSGRNHSGNSTSITTSDAAAQERLYRKVMRQAQVTPDEVSYVAMHQTGTQTGDPAEMNAVANTFKHRKRNLGPLPVGAVKANFGHGEAAAGMTELMGVIKMFQTDTIPPQAGMPHTLNPKFPPLKDINIEIPSESKPYPKHENGKPRRILLNNFDAAGGNACMLIEEYRPATERQESEDLRSAQVVATSARTKAAFEGNKNKLIEWLEANPDTKLQDLAYTSTARRMHHSVRFATSATSVKDLISKLKAAPSDPKPASSKAGIVFTYTGQGSHYAGMGAELYRTSAIFRETVDLCAAIGLDNGFPSFLDIISDDKVEMSSKEAVQIQLAVVALEIGLTAFWRSAGIQPRMVMGHSLGEYAALYAAGVLSLSDTLYLVGSRAMMLQERCEAGSCAMLAVSTSVDTVRSVLDKLESSSVGVACINSPTATVVSGTAEDLSAFEKEIKQKDSKVRTTSLPVPYAFHSFQTEPILQDYLTLAGGVTYAAPKIPIASTLLGKVIDSSSTFRFNPEYLCQQTREPVNFVGALKAVKEAMKDAFWLELGPGPVCASFVRATLSPPNSQVVHTLESNSSNWASISKTLSNIYMEGFDVDWLAFHKPYEKDLQLLTLPSYTWDMKNYWMTYTDRKEGTAVEEKGKAASAPEPQQPWVGTTAQYLVSASSSPNISLTFRAFLADPGFMGLIDGHRMQGVGLASGSVFCDAALTAARYALEFTGRKGLTARNMTVHDPELLAPLTKKLVGTDGQLLTTATMESTTSNVIKATFKAVSAEGAEHNLGSIRIELSDPQKTQAEWDRTSYFVKTMAEARVKASKEGSGHVLQPEVVYALFAQAVEFDPSFQGIQEAYMAKDFQEAAAVVSLKEDPGDTRFSFSPYWSEALAHLAGFMVNGNPTKSSRVTFAVMGFDSVEQTVDFEPGKTYLTYTRINRWEKEIAFCDAYVFDPESNKIIMQARDLRYQQLPVVVWKNILEGKHGGSSGEKKAHEPKKVASKPSAPERADAPAPTAPEEPQANATAPAPSQDNGSSGKVFELMLEAIAKATGEEPSDITDDMQLADIGVDSIMAIEVSSEIASATGLDLPATFVFDYPTIGDLRAEFGASGGSSQPTPEPPSESTSAPSEDSSRSSSQSRPKSDLSTRSNSESKDSWSAVDTPDTASTSDEESFEKVEKPVEKPKQQEAKAPVDDRSPQPNVRITLLKGRPGPGKTPVYLLADGTGSIATYIHIPALKSKAPVYGVDSPFLRCPSRLTPEIGIEGTAKMIVDALCKAQPTGPFIIGGFSAGSIVAYEVARQLPYAGRQVDGLTLIDMCCPRADTGVKLTEAQVNDEADTGITVFGNAAAKDGMWTTTDMTREHLRTYLLAMRLYHPPPMEAGKRPGYTAVIWARKGLVNRVRDDPKTMQILKDNEIPTEAYPGFMEDPKLGPFATLCPDKTENDLGPNGWDKYVGENVLCLNMDGDHMDLPMPGYVHLLHAELEKGMEKFAEVRK